MDKPVRENLYEAKLNLPQDYINKVRTDARQTYGLRPSQRDMMDMGRLLQQIFGIQRGHEEELTELGKEVIQKFYGPVIDGVELDVKIVGPEDQEKREMAEKMLQQQQQQQQEEQEEDEGPEVELDLPGIEHDIDKRKLINNVMQGEAQNVHDMMYDVRDKVTEITGNDQLLDLYMRFLALNKKFDWDESVNLEQMMQQMPQMANAMETEWEEGEEGGDDKPKIKARVLDLPMLVHETVKGIYELIAAGAIDPDPVRAQKVLNATDSLSDEQEDIRFGPYIAKDLRKYVTDVAENVSGAFDIPNLQEFVFGQMITMPSKEFVEFITAILEGEEWPAKTIEGFIKQIQEEFTEYNRTQIPGYEPDEDEDEDEALPPGVEEEPEDDELQQLINQTNKPKEESPKKKWVNMGQAELNYQLNQAIDNEDWETAQEIQKYLKTNESDDQLLNDLFDAVND